MHGPDLLLGKGTPRSYFLQCLQLLLSLKLFKTIFWSDDVQDVNCLEYFHSYISYKFERTKASLEEVSSAELLIWSWENYVYP